METIFLAFSLTLPLSLNLQMQLSPPKEVKGYDAHSRSIEVPQAKGNQVVIDGKFSEGEWDDALIFPIAEGREVRVKADSQTLYIGLKANQAVAIGVCEIRYTENHKDFYLLHVSARLGEGVSTNSGNRKFEMDNIENWECNLATRDKSKTDAWVAAARPVDKYAELFERVDGKEFRIDRKTLTGNRLIFTLGGMEFATDGKRANNYPKDVSFENADKWVELILPVVEQ